MINIISGGLTLVRASNRSMKHYVRAAQYSLVFSFESNRHWKVSKIPWEPITFYEEEEEGVHFAHDNPMIIWNEIADFDVGWVLVDKGSSINIIFTNAFRELGIEGKHNSLLSLAF